MARIAFLYNTTAITDITFDEYAEHQELFETIKSPPPVIVGDSNKGRLLNGYGYEHLLFSHYELDVVISANELNDEKLLFFDSYKIAAYKYIARYVSGIWSNYIPIMYSDSLAFVDDIEILPELTIHIEYEEPV